MHMSNDSHHSLPHSLTHCQSLVSTETAVNAPHQKHQPTPSTPTTSRPYHKAPVLHPHLRHVHCQENIYIQAQVARSISVSGWASDR